MAAYLGQYLAYQAINKATSYFNNSLDQTASMPLQTSTASTFRSRRGKVKRTRYAKSRVPRSLVRSIVNQAHERKTQATEAIGVALGTGMSFTLMNPLSQGTGGNQRIGRDVVNERVNVRYQIQGGAINAADVCRVLLLYDKESRGALPATSDVVTNTSAGYIQISTLNEDNLGNRFIVLMDNLHAIQPSTTTSFPFAVCVKSIKKTWMTHYYNTNVGTIADIDSGALVLCMVSYLNACTITYDIQTVYRDR
jgi:hypothetical protein